MSDYHQPGYGPPTGGPQQPYGTPQHGAHPAATALRGSAAGLGRRHARRRLRHPGVQQPGPGHPGPGYGTQPPAPPTGPAMWAHLGALLTITAGTMMCCGLGAFLGWIFPLSLRGNDRHKHDPYIRHHATQAVNFGITQAIMAALGMVLYVASAFIFAAAATTDAQRNSSGLAVPLLTVIGIFGRLHHVRHGLRDHRHRQGDPRRAVDLPATDRLAPQQGLTPPQPARN